MENLRNLPARFWASLETIPGGTALPGIWKREVQEEYGLFKELFLREKAGELAEAVPCPWGCGCLHKVVREESGRTLGLCQCERKQCDDFTVVREDRIWLELDWVKMGQGICRALGARRRLVKVGVFNTMQIGAWSAEAVPVVLSVSASEVELLNAVAVLIRKFEQPFMLVTPTARHVGRAARELLANRDCVCLALEAHMRVEGEAGLVCDARPEELFGNLATARGEPTDEEAARRAFLVLRDEESRRRWQKPSLYTVFQLYCVKELTIPEVAKKCGCSMGTVANRLKLLEWKTGMQARELRRVSGQFAELEEDVKQAQKDYAVRHR